MIRAAALALVLLATPATAEMIDIPAGLRACAARAGIAAPRRASVEELRAFAARPDARRMAWSCMGEVVAFYRAHRRHFGG